MAKKSEIKVPISRKMIFTRNYKGYADEIPQELKDDLLIKMPHAAKFFEKETII